MLNYILKRAMELCDSPLKRAVGVCLYASLTHPYSRTFLHAPSQEGNFILSDVLVGSPLFRQDISNVHG